MTRQYFVYILGNQHGVLYAGVTNDLERRLWEHRTGQASKFTRKYAIHRLLFWEEFQSRQEAIDTEKRIKGWTRKKKLDLIRTKNPRFKDLGEGWFDE